MPSSTLLARPAEAPAAAAAAPRRRTRVLALPEARWAAAALVLFLTALPLQLAGAPAWSWGPLYALAYAAGGWEPGRAGLQALREKTLDVDLLMIVAALGAAAVGQVMDGALLIVIFATSGALEALATARTADSVRGLLDLAPAVATRLPDDGTEERVPTGELAVGDVVLVRPGERIGTDGRVLDGVSEVDQASITGEPLPVAKRTGDEVFAGTLNGTGALRVKVERDASDSVIARIVQLVEEASETKAPTQLFIEKVEQRYSLGMVAATLAVFAVPLLVGAAFTDSLLRAMTFMIVASPCAVVLATMPPLLSAIANAGRHGVLVKSAVVMERLGQVDAVALDKTGTLTEGTPRVTDVRPLAGAGPDEDGLPAGAGPDEDGLLALAASAEHPSEHPLARAVVDAARARGLDLAPAADFASTPGVGVTATVAGRTVAVGAPAHRLGTARPLGTADPAAGRATPPTIGSAADPATDPTTAPARATAAPAPAADLTSTHGTPARPIDPVRSLGTADPTVPPADARTATPVTARAAAVAAELERSGRTAVLVEVDGVPVGVLGIADRLRPDAAATVTALTALTGTAPVLLTGDNPRAAARLAAEVGITDVRAGLLPQDKVAAVREQEGAGRKVLVVGDGVNDAPALAAAHTGVAMGRAGSDLALETADAVIVRDELATVPAVVALSRRARSLVVQNLVIASVFITALVVWDLVATLPLPLGVLGHEGSTVIVGLNGLRLLRDAAWKRAAAEGRR
ncbi:heavy metal translocating P-type ATPase [Kitasatospora cineracea]|uniref:P-type E1-E2 ATPase/heavy metal translocating P-type ATPase n=1 Tax=Kitasatospora cineracea TaxID=88074 RepID=A0A3N4RSV9_9ACTN|nr:heavy metal translocating P-type ATPase [Kitasatospora cineracea]RPE35976.1 P-type E1-E2 ATPase/heavy metal translocating P-type ATPase [Kitasatospora cineracea]